MCNFFLAVQKTDEKVVKMWYFAILKNLVSVIFSSPLGQFAKKVLKMANCSNIQISNEQAQQFARAIYTDVIDYVKSHKEEYKEFLAKEKLN